MLFWLETISVKCKQTWDICYLQRNQVSEEVIDYSEKNFNILDIKQDK